MTQELLSLNKAAEQGIARLRKPIWAMQEDHLKIDIFDGRLGPWVHLFSPFNLECNGRDPVNIIVIEFDCETPEYLAYTGPIADSEDYKKAQARFAGCMQA